MENINGALAFGSTLDNTDFNRKLAEMEAKIKGTTGTIEGEGNKWGGLIKGAAIGMAGAFTLQGANAFRQQLIQVRGEFQKYEAVLTNSLGSQSEAAASMTMLSDVASKTPFQLNSLTAAYVKLVNQGFKPSREEIIKLGDLASSTGKDFGQLAEAILDAQTGQFERLKEFGIKASASGDQIAFSFKGVTTTVQNSGTAIRDYMLSLGDLQGVKGSMEAISKTLQGQVSNLEDSITAMFNKMGTASEGFLSDSIAATKFLVDNYAEVAKILGVLVASYGSYKAAVILVTVLERARVVAMKEAALAGRALTTWEVLHSQALKSLQAAQMLLNRTMLANPYALVAAAIAGVVAYLILYNKKLNDAEKLEQRHNEIRKKFIDSLEEENVKTEALLATVNNEAIGKNKRLKALNDLKAASDGYLDGLTLENLKTAEGAGLLAGYNKELERKIYLQANQEEKVILIKEKRELEKQKKQIEKDIKDLEAQKYNPQLTQASSFAPASSTDVVTNAIDQTLNKRTQLLEKQNLVVKQIGELDKEQADLEAQSAKSTSATGKAYGTVAAEIADIDTQLSSLLKKKMDLPAVDKKGITDINNQINALNARKKLLEDTGSSVPKDKPSDVTQAQKIEADRYNARVALHKAATDQMALTEKAFSDKVIALGGQVRDANIKAIEDRAKAQQEALAASETLETKLLAIQTEYAAKEAALKSVPINKKEMAERLVVLEDEKKAAIANAVESSTAIMEMGRLQLKEFLAQVKAKIEGHQFEGESLLALQVKYDAATKALQNMPSDDPFVQLAESIRDYGNAIDLDKTTKLSESLQGVVKAAREVEGEVGGVVDILSSLGAISNEQADYVKETASQVAGLAEGVANVGMGLLSMNPAQIIKGVIDIVGNAIKLLDVKGKKISNTQKEVTAEIKKMDEAYKKLDASIKSALGTDVYKTQREQYKLNVDEMAKYDELIALERSKKKKKQNQDDIDSWNDAKMQLEQSNKDLLDNITESLAQTNAKDLAGKIADSIVGAFAAGTDAAVAWGEVVDNVIKNAALNALKLKFLEKPMQEVVDYVARAAEDAVITPEEIAGAKAIIEGPAQLFAETAKALTEIFPNTASSSGVDSSKTSALTGSIKGVTEETASVLAGTLNGMKMNQAEGMAIMRNQLFHLANIDVNTFNLHSMSRDLADIKRQIVSPNINMLP